MRKAEEWISELVEEVPSSGLDGGRSINITKNIALNSSFNLKVGS